jgi:hypothetical protein
MRKRNTQNIKINMTCGSEFRLNKLYIFLDIFLTFSRENSRLGTSPAMMKSVWSHLKAHFVKKLLFYIKSSEKFIFLYVVYTKTIRQLSLVVSERIVNSASLSVCENISHNNNRNIFLFPEPSMFCFDTYTTPCFAF